jgi:hypothetical protein
MKNAFSKIEVSVADPDPVLFDLWIRDGKFSSLEVNIPDHIFERKVTIFWVKNTQFLCCAFGSGIRYLLTLDP